jgi:endonuclease I
MKTNIINKGIQLIVAFMATIQLANAQAVLPTSWDFDAATPTGWTESLGSSAPRYSTGFVGSACRLDATGDYVVIEFAEEPGEVAYAIKGQNTGGAWQGTFTVEESANGTAFTPLHTFVNGDMNATAFTQYTESPQATTRFIRFYFTTKISGHNIALDEVSIAAPTAGNAQEINANVAGNNVPSESTYIIGDAAVTSFTIDNLGLTADLNISNISISGTDAADFTLGALPTVVAAGASESFDLNFAPTGTGSRFCTITIDNDDASENPYIINIYGVAGGQSTQPTAQAAAITFSGVKSWDFNVNFTAGSPAAEKYIVLRSNGSAVVDAPSDNTTYLKGQWIGASQVCYIGDAGSFNARNIEASSDYYFAVFAFNGPAGFENYLTSSPTSGMAATMDPNFGTYWNGLNHNEATFVTELTSALFPSNYFQVYYSNYSSTLINEFYVTDTVANGVSKNAVECQYSGDHYMYESTFAWWNGQNEGILSREHSFPQSWMPTYLDAGFDDSDEVSDLHNLFPVRQVECNAVRSNYPYGEVVTPSSTYGPCQYGANAIGQNVYEPRDEIKGEAARALMYQATKNNAVGDDFSFPEQISLVIQYGQPEYIIKKWHFQDLPTNYEIARNEYIEERQNNRNAFIDSTLFPCFIRFSNLTKWQPQVVYSNQTLTCYDQGLSYQWYLNGEPVENATNSTLQISDNGNYSLAVQQFEQCPTIESTPIAVTDISVSETELENFTAVVYPNPAKGNFNLSVSSVNNERVRFEILNSNGATVSTESKVVAPGTNVVEFNNNLSAGVYYIRMITSEGVLVKTVVVE